MFLLRLLGTLFLLIATLSLIHDASQTFSHGNGLLVTPLGQHWHDLSPSSLVFLRNAVRDIWPWIWDVPISSLLGYPAWVLFGIIGTAICYAGRNRRSTNIFAN